MKISLWNLFIFTAIVAIALGFALHIYVTEQRIAMFQRDACHEMAHIAFFARLDAVRDNFRNAGIELKPSVQDFEWATDSGTFIREYNWTQNQTKKLSAFQIHQLTLPITQHLGDEASPWIRWDVEVVPDVERSVDSDTPANGQFEFRIKYLISMPKL